MGARGSRTVRIALAFGLVIASCPIASKLATLGRHAAVPGPVASVVRPVPAAVPGEPRPPWLNDPSSEARLYFGGRAIVLGAPKQKRK